MTYFYKDPPEWNIDRTEFYCEFCDGIKEQESRNDSDTYTCLYCENENKYDSREHKYIYCDKCDNEEVHFENECVKCESVNYE